MKRMFLMNEKACYIAEAISEEHELRFYAYVNGTRYVIASVTDTKESGLLFCQTDGQKIVAQRIEDPEFNFRNPDGTRLPIHTDNQIEVTCGYDNRMLIFRNDVYDAEIITDAILLLVDKSFETKVLAHVYIEYESGGLVFDFDFA